MIKVQKSFQEKQKILYLVATPIGHLQELTPRALEVLKNAELVLCESIYSYLKLTNYFQINQQNQKTITYDNLKEKSEFQVNKILSQMEKYKKIALVSKAGYPIISDPGRVLVNKWVRLGNYIVPISGSSAFLNSLVASGIYYHHFSFLGFLPRNDRKQQLIFQTYRQITSALIVYESPHRLINTLNNIKSILGNRSIVIAREITKIYEEFIRGSAEEVIDYLTNKNNLRGELTIIVGIDETNFIGRKL